MKKSDILSVVSFLFSLAGFAFEAYASKESRKEIEAEVRAEKEN